MPELRDRLQARLSGSYNLGRELGGGGMSRVFVAEDASLGRTVVIKVLRPDLAAGLNAERFKREILLAAQLQHPHIVPVLAAGVADELPYFVMPFVVGESLRNKLSDEKGLGVAETISILRDVARALGFAHAQGVVHRDIKPDNVLLAGGSAVVTDFGIAKAITSAAVPTTGATLTQVGTSIGTPSYMSPEQAAGDPNADARSDFYSFGVMAYEMLAGRTPFYDRAAHALIMAHIAELPEPIERLVPSLPSELAELVMQCLAKNPADRPQTARDILEDLNDIHISGERVRSGPHGTGVSAAAGARARVDTGPNAYPDGTVLVDGGVLPQKVRSRKKLALIAGAAAVILGVAGTFGWKLFAGTTSRGLDEHSLAVVPFRVASADPSLHYLREGMVDLIAAKLSGEDLRAVEPRTLLDAWRNAGGSETADLSREATIRLARELRAGKTLLGDVVGTPNRLTVTVSVLNVPKGEQIARASVDGPPDSLASLVDRIALQLLTQTSGEAPARLSTLTSTSLPALRAYLDGQARLRRSDAFNAAKDFERALKEDSTFALAGLGLRMATSWYGDAELGNRGLQIALREKARLSYRDQMLLTAVAGPRYPATPTNAELYQAREQFLNNAHDNAEAWYLFADHIFHFGAAMGIIDWEERALAGFRKSMELDSLYLPGYAHALPLAPSLGDTAFTNRAARLRFAADTSAFLRRQHDWYMAVRRGDRAAADEALSIRGELRPGILQGVIRHTIFDGTGPEYAKAAVEEMVAESPTDAVKRGRSRFAHDVMLNLGRPAEALRYLRAAADTGFDLNVAITTVRDAIMGEGIRSAGDEAAKLIAPIEARPPTDSTSRLRVRGAVRVMEAWRLSRGDTTQTRASLSRLQSLMRYASKSDSLPMAIEIAYIQLLHADATGSPALRSAAQRLDSLIQAQDFQLAHAGRLAEQTLAAARAFEKLGDHRRALAAAGRYAMWNTESMPYIGLQIRELGRIAGLADNPKRAIRSYRHYLAMRKLAEPSLQPQIDSVRRELAAIEGSPQR